jgi:hypothetical protein
MSVVGAIGCRIQKCLHRLARYSRAGLFCAGLEAAIAWKQDKRTTETGLAKWIFYEEVHVSFGWLTRIVFSFSQVFLGGHFKKIQIFFGATPKTTGLWQKSREGRRPERPK